MGADGRGADKGKIVDPQWKVEDGYFEVGANNGDLFTREKFGDCQMHIEWSEPPDIKGTSQGRGNSGVLLMRRYEIQVLDIVQTRRMPTARRVRFTGSGRRWRIRPGRRASGTCTTSCSKRRSSKARSW